MVSQVGIVMEYLDSDLGDANDRQVVRFEQRNLMGFKLVRKEAERGGLPMDFMMAPCSGFCKRPHSVLSL